MEGHWKVHLPNLLHEILDSNSQMGIFRVPLHITGLLLAAVGDRAAEINDPELNDLMCRLTIYTVADPQSPDYDPKALDEIRKAADTARYAREK